MFLSSARVIATVAANAEWNVNMALNRPTFAVSVYNHPNLGGDFLPSRAVDGNPDPDALKVDNSCFVSYRHYNPWWAASSSKRTMLLSRFTRN